MDLSLFLSYQRRKQDISIVSTGIVDISLAFLWTKKQKLGADCLVVGYMVESYPSSGHPVEDVLCWCIFVCSLRISPLWWKVLAITENLHDVHSLGKEATAMFTGSVRVACKRNINMACGQ